MIKYIKNTLEKRKLKSTFQEYGFEVKQFDVEGIGTVEYAQWLHPYEKPKVLGISNVQFYERLSRKGGMIIDIGAHTGDTTIPMALAVGKEGLVLGLEPNKYVYKILEKNASLNQQTTNIIPLCFAATEEEGVFTFNYFDASFCNGGFLSQMKNKRHGNNFKLDVVGKNLQDYLLNNHKAELKNLDLIKIDAEGYDKTILKSISTILKDYKPNLMIECYKKLNEQERGELFDVVTENGYKLYFLENFELFDKLIPIQKSNMSDIRHFEILAIHDSKEMVL